MKITVHKKLFEYVNRGIAIILALTLIWAFSSSDKVNAAQISPSVIDVFVKQGENFDGNITFRNTSDTELELRPTVEAYNAKEARISEEKKTYVKTAANSYKVDAGKTVSIKYFGHIPEDTPIGTYFNVIGFIEQTPVKVSTKDANFDILKGEGALVAIHVFDQSGQMTASSLDVQLDTTRDWFIPRILPTDATVTITNNSPYVMDVLGEARIITSSGEIVETDRLTSTESRLYPGDSLEKEFTVNPFTFKDTSIVYSFTSNMTPHEFTGFKELPNYALTALLSVLITFVAILIAFIMARISRKNRFPI